MGCGCGFYRDPFAVVGVSEPLILSVQGQIYRYRALLVANGVLMHAAQFNRLGAWRCSRSWNFRTRTPRRDESGP